MNPQGAAAARPEPRRFPHPLPDGWYQVAHSDEVPIGAVRALRYFGRELVAFRGDDGVARVFDAHCPHMGAHLGRGGRAVGDRLRCPFHAWEFDGGGRCVSIPYAKRIPPRAALSPWLAVERNGMILVHFDKQGRPPRFEIPDVPEHGSPEWTDYIRRDFVVRSHAQELAENTVDPAHFKYVHRTAELPEARAWTEDHVFRVRMSYPIAVGEKLLHGTIDVSAHGLGWGVTRFDGIVHTLVVIGGTPIEEGLVHNRLSFMVKRLASDEATQAVGRAFADEIARQFREDMPIWEHKVYWEKPLLCDGDGPIALLRRWGAQFY
jgi:nitrite reductase/ring-hydroxylating ferredoxin subunit